MLVQRRDGIVMAIVGIAVLGADDNDAKTRLLFALGRQHGGDQGRAIVFAQGRNNGLTFCR